MPILKIINNGGKKIKIYPSFKYNDIHFYHNSQPLVPPPARNLSASTGLMRPNYAAATKYYLRYISQLDDSLRLSRESHFHASKRAQSPTPATKKKNINSCEVQENWHHFIRLEWLQSVLSTLPSTKIATSTETCELRYHALKGTNPPQTHNSPNDNLNGTAQQSTDLTQRCDCAAKYITFLARHIIVMQITIMAAQTNK